jgi:hypothetical protein
MKTFRKTFRMEVYINAETEQEADDIYENLNLGNLLKEKEDKVIVACDFVESYETEEQEDFID